jgi:hypothetical protein
MKLSSCTLWQEVGQLSCYETSCPGECVWHVKRCLAPSRTTIFFSVPSQSGVVYGRRVSLQFEYSAMSKVWLGGKHVLPQTVLPMILLTNCCLAQRRLGSFMTHFSSSRVSTCMMLCTYSRDFSTRLRCILVASETSITNWYT